MCAIKQRNKQNAQTKTTKQQKNCSLFPITICRRSEILEILYYFWCICILVSISGLSSSSGPRRWNTSNPQGKANDNWKLNNLDVKPHCSLKKPHSNADKNRVLDTSCKTMSCGPLRDRSLRFGHFVISHFVIGHFVEVTSWQTLRDEEKEKRNKRELKDIYETKVEVGGYTNLQLLNGLRP